MKNLGKIGLAAGLAAAVYVLIRKRADGTRMLDDVTNQVTKWANTLMKVRENLQQKPSKGNVSKPGQAPRTSMAGGNSTRHAGTQPE